MAFGKKKKEAEEVKAKEEAKAAQPSGKRPGRKAAPLPG